METAKTEAPSRYWSVQRLQDGSGRAKVNAEGPLWLDTSQLWSTYNRAHDKSMLLCVEGLSDAAHDRAAYELRKRRKRWCHGVVDAVATATERRCA